MENQAQESEKERIVKWLQASIEFGTITQEEAFVYYEAYLEIEEFESPPMMTQPELISPLPGLMS